MPFRELKTRRNTGKIVLKQAKKNKEVVFGARALNKQVIGFFKIKTFDWDLYSKNPRKSARQLERKLDKSSGKNIYYTKPALHPGTTKVVHKGQDAIKGTRDDFGVADYTKKPKRLNTVIINGVRYASIKQIKKNRLRAIRKPEAQFRRRKDEEALNIIKGDEALKKI